MPNKQPKKSDSDESGMVSIIVVSVMSIILALVSIGFSHLMDRELKQSVDRELAAQAYYAAESGLNDARAYLEDGGGSFAGCATPSGAAEFVPGGDISGGTGAAKYTCVSVDTAPDELIYALNPGQSVTLKVDINNLNNLFIGWENQSYPDGPQPLGGFGTLPREDQIGADSTGVLRVGLYPVPRSMPSVGNTDNYLNGLARAYFLYPNGGGGAPGTVNYSSNGSFVAGNCNISKYTPTANRAATPRYCNSEITGLNGGPNTYFIRLTAQYAPLNISIQATNNANNKSALSFSNTQAVVDVTGSGADELQRVQARIDLTNHYEEPSYTLQSMVAICKGFRVYMVGLGEYGGIMPPGLSVNDSDGACASPSGGGSVVGSSGDLGPHS